MFGRCVPLLACGVGLCLALGCGGQRTQLLSPVPEARPGQPSPGTLASRVLGEEGPVVCFFDHSFSYCYPSGGYCPCPEREILRDVPAGRVTTMNWYAVPAPYTNIRWYRWALDIEDVGDETPRINEETDLTHWSIRRADPGSARLGPWSAGEQHRLYVDVSDDQGLRSLGIVKFTAVAVQNGPPECALAAARPSELWPPNHAWVPITIAGVTDPDGDPVTIAVDRVTQDEPVSAGGAGETCPDAVIGPGGAVSLRAERSGRGNGRVYTIWFTATDAQGASCEGSVRVCVPHDRSRACVDDGQRFDSREDCDAVSHATAAAP